MVVTYHENIAGEIPPQRSLTVITHQSGTSGSLQVSVTDSGDIAIMLLNREQVRDLADQLASWLRGENGA